jgi:DNA-binding ferritin-like protein (Dps family)
MTETAQEWNNKFHNELSDTFNDLDNFSNVDQRLGYETVEKMFQDDILKIKNAVLEIYSQNDQVDWGLIKPLKNNLKLLQKKLDLFENARVNKRKISQTTINSTRNLIDEI